MKLYDLPRGSYFKLIEDPQVPPDAFIGKKNMQYKLMNLDGMYSYIIGSDKNVYHFAAWTEVEKVNDDSVQTIS